MPRVATLLPAAVGPPRAPITKPGPFPVIALSLGLFLAIVALLAFQMRAGADPAIGKGEPVQVAAATPRAAQGLIRRVIVTRIVEHRRAARRLRARRGRAAAEHVEQLRARAVRPRARARRAGSRRSGAAAR